MKTKQWLCLAALTTMINAPVNAGEWVIKAGGFWAQTDSSMTTKTLLDRDLTLDFEDTFNLEEEQFLPFAQIGYQFNDRHHVFADWRRLHRSAQTKAVGAIESLPNFPEYGIAAGASINTRMDIDVLRAGYGYSFYKTERVEIGGSLGLHVMFIEMGFSGEIAGCVEKNGELICESTSTSGEVVDESITAPLPDIGFWASYEFADDWTIAAHSEVFYISLDNVSGYLTDLNATISYAISPNWDAEIGYNYYQVGADWDETSLKYKYQGPMFNVAYKF
ncbi:hypothetical protein [Agarivorans sp. DSG3-1]|uniref:hypothetical protein n=1 Tax=Agarivorans sp. DSG3-1 TaxID=3342249 RepID=UPI00398F7A9A